MVTAMISRKLVHIVSKYLILLTMIILPSCDTDNMITNHSDSIVSPSGDESVSRTAVLAWTVSDTGLLCQSGADLSDRPPHLEGTSTVALRYNFTAAP